MFTVNAKLRKKQGKSENRRLRATNKIPAVVYGNDFTSIAIELQHDEIWSIQDKAEFYKDVLVLSINNSKEKVKVQAIQRHPFKKKIVHIDFIRI